MGQHLDAIVPLFLKFLGDPSDEALQTEAHNDLRETCLQGFESFALRCPAEIAPHLEALTHSGMAFARFDPNFCGDDDDEAEDEEDEEDEDGGGDDEDDDTSWKVLSPLF